MSSLHHVAQDCLVEIQPTASDVRVSAAAHLGLSEVRYDES